jgi:hypothetical protein
MPAARGLSVVDRALFRYEGAMTAERLDKQWQEKGLHDYSTAAILGTLTHYGVSIDSIAFRAQAELFYPLTIAQSWVELWKGTGKFAKLPAVAVEELWRRLAPDLLQPLDVIDSLTELMKSLLRLRKKEDAPVAEKFDALDAVLKRLPEPGERRDHFMAEVVMVLSGSIETLDLMAEGLAREGHLQHAERFVAVEELLFPVRKGVSSALVLAAKGEREPALKQLQAICDDAARDDYARVSAVDALIHLKAAELSMPTLISLGEKANEANDGEFLGELDRRWHAVVEGVPAGAMHQQAKAELRKSHQRIERFGGHGHHHH